MTSTTKYNPIPRISTQELKILSGEPGTLRVIVKQVNGYFMPIVHYAPPNEEAELRGVVMEGNNVLATVELADVVTALEEIIGIQDCILTPEIPDGIVMH
jgi:hypothetical protein